MLPHLVKVRKGHPGGYAMIGKTFIVRGSTCPDLLHDGVIILLHKGQTSGLFGESISDSLRGIDVEALEGEYALGCLYVVHHNGMRGRISVGRIEDFLSDRRAQFFEFKGRLRSSLRPQYWIHLDGYKKLPFQEPRVPPDQCRRYPSRPVSKAS